MEDIKALVGQLKQMPAEEIVALVKDIQDIVKQATEQNRQANRSCYNCQYYEGYCKFWGDDPEGLEIQFCGQWR